MIDRVWTKGVGAGVILALLALSGGRATAASSEETQLNQEETAINQQAVPKDAARIEALSKQYGVEPSVVEQIHTTQPGWGGVTIKLAMAQNLTKTDPTRYPTMSDALTKVEALRADGKGYGAIAKELGFKLGPVISAAKHTRNEMRHESHSASSPGQVPAEKGHAGKPPHAEKPPRPEKPNHPEKMPKPEKPPKP
jgi:hypothetical protein